MPRRKGDPVPLRFEWERVIKRLILPPTVKHIALTLATYGDLEGRSIRPGNEALVGDTCTSRATVWRALAHLRDLGLIVSVGTANRRRKIAEEYHLSIPSDLCYRVGSRSPLGTLYPPADQGSERALVGADQGSHRNNQGSQGNRSGLTQKQIRAHTEPPPEQDHLSDHTTTTRAAEFVDVSTDRATRSNGHRRYA
jgi:hypothetical protein